MENDYMYICCEDGMQLRLVQDLAKQRALVLAVLIIRVLLQS